MKRRVILEIAAVMGISLTLLGTALWANWRDEGAGPTDAVSPQQGPEAMPWLLAPTPDPYHLPTVPAEYRLHYVGPQRCHLPDAAVEVLAEDASQKRGHVFDDGAKRYYVTPNGNCVTFENDNRDQRDWIPLELQVRLDTSKDDIHPCLVSDDAVEVFTQAAAQAGGRVFEDSSGREYLTADGRCAHIAMLNPPDWLSPEFVAKMSDPNRNLENWSTPYPPEVLATLLAEATATAIAYERQGP